MEAVRTVAMLALTLFAVGYALWVAVWFRRGERPRPAGEAEKPPVPPHRDIIGKSRFVMPARRLPEPTAATDSDPGTDGQKEDNFVPESVPQHPRQIPPEKLDEVFGTPPEGERNDPDDIDCPLLEAQSPDYEADMDSDMETDDENEDESQPPAGRSLAKGVLFENIREAYRTVVHDDPLTDEKQQETGRTLLGLKQTDMFEAIVSARPDGNDKVGRLIDAHLTAFHQQRIAGSSAGSPSPPASVPDGFDVRSFV